MPVSPSTVDIHSVRRDQLWYLPASKVAFRLFLTCWLIYSLHVATNTVREIYLALSLADHLSFRVDDYAHLHPDLFEKPGYGWHIGANPGGSLIGAIPYALAKPVVDPILKRVNQQRAGQTNPPVYNSPYPLARKFFEESWRRGLDVKFGLAAIIMQTGAMAPISALGAVIMFYLLRHVFSSDRTALWMALLYAFGTPVFFRTGYLNHNLMIAHFALFGFLMLWNPSARDWPSLTARYFLAGVCGGMSLLLDYSGVMMLLGLFGYAVLKVFLASSLNEAIRRGAWYVAGTLPPVGMLWFYQWRSFGHPFYPGQHWMPPVAWIEVGYQGFGPPQFELLWGLLFDYRYGLFLSCPLFLLAVLGWVVNRYHRFMPDLELGAMLALAVGLWLFCGGISYTRLQYNTGIRYLAPLFPFVFVPAAIVLAKAPGWLKWSFVLVSVTQAWSMAMYRDVELGLGLLEPPMRILLGGFQLPLLTTLQRMGGQFGDYFRTGASPLPLFALAGVILFLVWRPAAPAADRR